MEVGVGSEKKEDVKMAKVTLDENEETIKGPSEHKHPPKSENLAVGKIISNMRRMASETTSTPNIKEQVARH